MTQQTSSDAFHDTLIITSDAALDHAFTLARSRCVVMGGEARGIDEVRVHPHAIVRELRVADAHTTGFQISRIGIERTLQVAAGPIRERILVATDAPGAVIEWSTEQDAGIEVRWHVDSAIGATPTANALIVQHPSGDDILFEIDGAEPVWSVGHDSATNRITVSCRIQIGRYGVRLVIASGDSGTDVAAVAQLLKEPSAIIAARTGALARARSERLLVHTPDARINDAIAWSAHRNASYAVAMPRGGTGLVDSYSARVAPVVAAHAAVWTALALLAAGEDKLPRDVIRFLLEQQDADGNIPESCALDGSVTPGTSESTALLLRLVARYSAWTGNLEIATRSWDAIVRACSAVSARPATRLTATALDEIALVAEALGKTQAAADIRARSATAARSISPAAARGRIALPVAGDAAVGQASEEAFLGAFVDCAPCEHFARGNTAAGFDEWKRLAGACFESTKGAWPDGASSDAAVPSASVMLAFVHGILGAEPDASKHRLVLRPQIPAEWHALEVTHLRMGEADISVRYVGTAATHRFTLEQRAGHVPVRVIFEPIVPAARVTSAQVDGQAASLDPHPFGERLRVPVQIVLDHERTVELVTSD